MQAREVRKPYALKGLSSSPLWNWLLLPCSLCHQQPRTAQKHIFQTENCCAPLARRIISKCVVCNCYHLGDSSKLICPSAVSENSNLDFCFTDILLTRRRPFQGLELVSQSKVSYTLDPEPSENDRWPRMKKKKEKTLQIWLTTMLFFVLHCLVSVRRAWAHFSKFIIFQSSILGILLPRGISLNIYSAKLLSMQIVFICHYVSRNMALNRFS